MDKNGVLLLFLISQCLISEFSFCVISWTKMESTQRVVCHTKRHSKRHTKRLGFYSSPRLTDSPMVATADHS